MKKPKNTEEWLENLRKTMEKLQSNKDKKKTTTRKKSTKKETE